MDMGQDHIGQSAFGDVRVPASADDTGPRVSYYWGLGSLRTGADMGPRLCSGARSDGHIKRVLLYVMADHGVRLPSRAAHIHTFVVVVLVFVLVVVVVVVVNIMVKWWWWWPIGGRHRGLYSLFFYCACTCTCAAEAAAARFFFC